MLSAWCSQRNRQRQQQRGHLANVLVGLRGGGSRVKLREAPISHAATPPMCCRGSSGGSPPMRPHRGQRPSASHGPRGAPSCARPRRWRWARTRRPCGRPPPWPCGRFLPWPYGRSPPWPCDRLLPWPCGRSLPWSSGRPPPTSSVEPAMRGGTARS